MTTIKRASCGATHVHYVSVSAGCGWNTSRAWGQSSASCQTDDPADRLTFGGLTAGGEGGVPDWQREEKGGRGRGGKDGIRGGEI